MVEWMSSEKNDDVGNCGSAPCQWRLRDGYMKMVDGFVLCW